ncbi:MAG: SGNH/GDSL hydrolase family protein [Aeromicrobium sp.]|uniref:SGNH/GDSL hydrolase family protein n=1 Tax=Aeromicrobium sp. TaxID=1871063 RepID=UPI003C3D3B42
MKRLIFAAVLALLTSLVLAAPSSAAKKPLRYVALGDSYSAASGVVPLDLTAPPMCLRSTRNYPHVLAAKIGAQLTDVTCGAADTSDFFTEQYDGVAPQLDALKRDTQLVTMTIGGNDSGVFIGAIVSCGTASAATLGQGSPCKDQYGSSFQDTINTTTYPSLVKTLKAVKARSPKAKVAILGYPEIVPPTTGCYPQLPLATGDVPYVHGIQKTLNSAVKRAAAKTKVTFVDFGKISVGHDACKAIGTRWIEPAVFSTNAVIVHPNALGEAKMAEQTQKVLKLR